MRQLYTLKFKSSRLKEFGYNINITFEEAKSTKEVIALADSQMLRTIRDLSKHAVVPEKVERLFQERDKLKKKYTKLSRNSDYKECLDRIHTVQDKINRTLFIQDYVSVVIDHPTHYQHIFVNGIVVNGVIYKRLSCSAGQARKSTVVLCNESILGAVRIRLENGRNNQVPLAPSKYNAYFGLSSSATEIVSEPKFIVVKDFENTDTFETHFVTETDWDIDDVVETKTVTQTLNRTDGMGLISPTQAEKWAKELGLDYIPSQFGIRQSFVKGMLCTFPIHDFCKEVNGGNYIVETIYKDENGEFVKADLRDYDVILSESQFKLWNCYSSLQEYIDCCHKNHLYWGITQYSPKESKHVLKMNYQFLQTLNLNKVDIEDLAKDFVEWVNGVSYENYPFLLLFLMGINNDANKIRNFLLSSSNYWLKSLIVCPDLRHDKYTKTKIKNLIKTKIRNGCMGDIFVDGNFQTLVSDPYGFMQSVCGMDVTGLLGRNEFYSNYWNEKEVAVVDGMRSPLTFRSEHVIMNLVKNKDTEKWYRYCKLGIILNYHGHEVCNFGGADFDLDILATTSNQTIINGVYKDELTMMYEPPKPKKIVFSEDDLYNSDVFSFGSIIGSITNKSSNAYALLSNIGEEYGESSNEYKTTYSRLIQCCKAQSAQIDKAKIGKNVKGIPKLWVEYQAPIIDDDTGEVISTQDEISQIEFYNRILLNKYPYFFRYRYSDCKKTYDVYVDQNEITCHQRFRMSLQSLINLGNKTEEQILFVNSYFKYLPVIMSNSPMNLLCKHIESVNFALNKKFTEDSNIDFVSLLKNHTVSYSDDDYNFISNVFSKFIKNKHFDYIVESKEDDGDDVACEITDFVTLEKYIKTHTSNMFLAANCAIDYFYSAYPSKNKEVLWSVFGRYLFTNLRKNMKTQPTFPCPCKDGDIKYLGQHYKMMEVNFE
ncbi:MAG: hypothetical protein RSF40_01775 [Oscillospiraceae bacterium]